MQIILSEKDISEYLGIFLKSKTLRDLINEKLYQYNENIDEDGGNEEKLLVINTDKIEMKKKRGRPSNKNKAKSNGITIEEENINLDI
jgi:hypothetical protein